MEMHTNKINIFTPSSNPVFFNLCECIHTGAYYWVLRHEGAKEAPSLANKIWRVLVDRGTF
jgi:hypothetical protein